MTKPLAIPSFALLALASLYLAAGLFGEFGNVQVAKMLGWQDATQGATLHLAYTAALFASALCGLILLLKNSRLVRWASVVLGLAITLATAICIFFGIAGPLAPSYYEHYLGEGFTIVAALLLVGFALIPQKQPPSASPT